MKKEVMFILGIILLMNFVFAFPTNITLKTDPNYKMDIRALNPSSGKTLNGAYFSETADENGLINVIYESLPEDPRRTKIHISVVDGQSRKMTLFKDVETNTNVYIDFRTEEPSIVVNQKNEENLQKNEDNHTENKDSNESIANQEENKSELKDVKNSLELRNVRNENNTLTQENRDNKTELKSIQEISGITGFSVSDLKELIFSKPVLYVFVVFCLIFLIAGVTQLKLRKKDKTSSINYRDKKDIIKDAEEKIKEAENEIEEAKYSDWQDKH